MGEARKDLVFGGVAAFILVLSIYTGQMYLAVVMSFMLGSLLTFALADYRDDLRRKCGLLR